MTDYTLRPAPDEFAPFYAGYISRVPEGGLVDLMRRVGDDTSRLLSQVDESRTGHAYATGKWTIREVAGHLCDAERIFGYRALRFARGDQAELQGFDENTYVPAGEFEKRTLASVVQELGAVRRATIELFGNLPADAWTRRGTANGNSISVRAIATVIVGHELHHRGILQERYGVK
jgi:hypothetical protein